MSIKKLIKKAEKNSNVMEGTKSNQKVVKKGVPLDHTSKHSPTTSDRKAGTVGVSFGVTLNMENYESARIDCWLTDTIGEKETQEQAVDRVFKVVENEVMKLSEAYRS